METHSSALSIFTPPPPPPAVVIESKMEPLCVFIPLFFFPRETRWRWRRNNERFTSVCGSNVSLNQQLLLLFCSSSSLNICFSFFYPFIHWFLLIFIIPPLLLNLFYSFNSVFSVCPSFKLQSFHFIFLSSPPLFRSFFNVSFLFVLFQLFCFSLLFVFLVVCMISFFRSFFSSCVASFVKSLLQMFRPKCIAPIC